MYNTLLKTVYFLSYVPGLYPNKFRNWFKEQKKILPNLKKNKIKPIWIHCSSLGEYEYIKPLIPELKKINSEIHLTFFSSSGITHFSDYQMVIANHITIRHQIKMLFLLIK